MKPFALTYAAPRPPAPATPFTYDAARQMSTCPDGALAAENYPLLLGTSSTTSTAGSATHRDDD
ncbi:putative ATP-grasp-modified RiPP [Streptomyces sp. NPDC015144]|uniref:putative ATP-grasp-modified RiPP n=1 Tax=Streptomyces sp. NPDC015144 TaxID=3364944 RepID=UPI00370037F3